MTQCTFLTFTLFSRGSSSRRIGNDREGERTSERDRDRDNFSKWRDRQYCGPRRWLESALKDSWDKDSGKIKTFDRRFPISSNFTQQCDNFRYTFKKFHR